MNRIIAPVLLALSLTLATAVVAAPLKTDADVSKFFSQLQLNGN
ncbi:MAG: hypothetical protein ABL901_21025 [Hyphomicrobiaceae bacterium]